jgi:uncharacterized membrane protein
VNEELYTEIMLTVAQTFEAIAAFTLLVGLVWASVISLRTYVRTRSGGQAYNLMRQSFGGAILLGLEILVAGDLIRTVAVAPTIDNVVVLGIIVLIRTFLSFSLEIEIDGTVPWKRALAPNGVNVLKRAYSTSNEQT